MASAAECPRQTAEKYLQEDVQEAESSSQSEQSNL